MQSGKGKGKKTAQTEPEEAEGEEGGEGNSEESSKEQFYHNSPPSHVKVRGTVMHVPSASNQSLIFQ